MTLLDNTGGTARATVPGHEEARWQEILDFLRDPGAVRPDPVASPRLVCHWVADPAAPGRMISVWEAEAGS